MNVVDAWRENKQRLRLEGKMCINGCGVMLGTRRIDLDQFNQTGLEKMGYRRVGSKKEKEPARQTDTMNK